MTLDYTGNCTFSGVAFLTEQTGDFARAAFPTERQLAIRHVPWGGRTIVQDLGAQATALTLTLTLLSSAYAALQAKVGTIGTLALVGAPAQSGVLLQTLTNVTLDDAHGIVTLQAQFLGGL
jgi:hypothetical protein